MTAVGGFRKWDIGAWLLQVDVDSLRKWSEMKKRYCLGVASSVHVIAVLIYTNPDIDVV